MTVTKEYVFQRMGDIAPQIKDGKIVMLYPTDIVKTRAKGVISRVLGFMDEWFAQNPEYEFIRRTDNNGADAYIKKPGTQNNNTVVGYSGTYRSNEERLTAERDQLLE